MRQLNHGIIHQKIRLEKISKEKLKEVSNIVGAAVYQVARPDTPALEKAKVAPKEVDYDFEERELE